MSVGIHSRRVRFGTFEVNLSSGELFKHGIRLKIQDQPFQILSALLERPGELVFREELRKKLWADDTFVDFDAGLNAAIRRLRDALNDSRDEPRYIETVPRHGYRFILPVEHVVDLESPTLLEPVPGNGHVEVLTAQIAEVRGQETAEHKSMTRWWKLAVASGLLIIIAGGGAIAWRGKVFVGHPSGAIHSIAVLPLQNLSGDPLQDYFADGMTDALITDLAQIKSLRVISRTSVMRYRDTRKKLSEIAKELNVDTLVEGAVVRSGDRVRIDAQLIRTDSEQHLWAKSYDRHINNVLTLQSEVARAIASEIQAELTPQEQSRLARAQTVDPAAYQFYLRGRYCWNKRTEEGYDKAIEFFDRAIALQPDYAQAYAGLADSYALLGAWTKGGLSRDQTISLARATAVKALELDNTLAEAHASLASISFVYDWNWPFAEKEFKLAIQLNPGYATAHHWYAYYCIYRGQTEDALREIRMAQQLDPLSLMINNDVGQILYMSRRYDEAIEEERRTLEMDPSLPWPHLWLGLAYLAKQQYPESISELQTNVRLSGSDPGSMATLGMAYAQAGQSEEAQKILEQIRTKPSEQYNTLPEIAWLLAALGERDQAFAWLERGISTRARAFKGLHVWPFLDPLRSDPRFQDLVRRVGLSPPALTKEMSVTQGGPKAPTEKR